MATAQHMYAALHGMWQEAVEAKEKAADTAQERAMELAAARQRMASLEAEVVARVLPPCPVGAPPPIPLAGRTGMPHTPVAPAHPLLSSLGCTGLALSEHWQCLSPIMWSSWQ